MSDITAKSLAFSKPYTAPDEGATTYLSLHTSTISPSSIPESSVVIKYLATPVNPIEFLVLAAKYPVKPVFKTENGDSILGFDGAAEVVHVGSSVTRIKVGDKVLPARHGLGTLRTYAVLEEKDVVVLPPSVDPKFAALVKMGFAPAFFLLEDMRKLNPGEWVIMNAGNSVIAQSMAQFAKLKGVKTILVVRDREESQLQELKANSSADIIITESQLAGVAPIKDNIVLAIDCVYGKSGHNLIRHLAAGGTYTIMGILSRSDPSSKDPVSDFRVEDNTIFFKAIEFKNFRLSRCLGTRSAKNVEDLMSWFCELQSQGVLKLPQIEINEWKEGTSQEELLDVFKKAEGARAKAGGKKQMFVFA